MSRYFCFLVVGWSIAAGSVSAQGVDSLATLEMNVDSLGISLEGIPEYILSATTPRQKLEFPKSWHFTDSRVVEWIVNQGQLYYTESPTSVKWIDITGDGAGINDVVIIEPDGNPQIISEFMMSLALQAYISEWDQEDNNNLSGVAEDVDPQLWDPEDPQYAYEEPQSPLAAMLSDIFNAVDRSYSLDDSIQLYLNKDDRGFNFEIYGYNPSLLAFEQKPPGVPDSVLVRDIFFNNRTVADTTYQSVLFDVVFLNRAVQDTLYIPDGLDEATRRRILGERE